MLKTITAKKPVALFEYEIFKSDIKLSGLEYVNLVDVFTQKGDFVKIKPEILEKGAEECLKMLFDKEVYEKMMEKDFKIGRESFAF